MDYSVYLSQPVPAGPDTGTSPAGCCSAPSSIGAAAATTPQDLRPYDATASGAPLPSKVGRAGGGRSCKCWWVALAAVAIVAVVARSQ
jgi:hypothetical protein